MLILLGFAFISGLITIAAPCIWPLLPIILSATATGGKRKPLGITVGVVLSFTAVTLSLSYLVTFLPIDPNGLRIVAASIIAVLGLALIIPKLSALLETWASKLTNRFAAAPTTQRGTDFGAGLVTGLALGIVWTPCAGPILATIAALAATRAVSSELVLVTLVYGCGVAIPLFLFATLGRALFKRSRWLNKYLGIIQRLFGVIMIATALAIITNFDKTLQAKLLDLVPSYANFITALESQPQVQQELDQIQGRTATTVNTTTDASDIFNVDPAVPAPELTGITHWLNTATPLTLAELRGKVVLIDFWTYTCINCIRTLPHVTDWYDKYQDQGFVVIGVHAPEFEFEKDTDNVTMALAQYGITYPVAQDNDFATWKAYGNHYWPAEYLIDAEGNVRRVHYGEGEYDVMEQAIQTLLTEAGQAVTETVSAIPDMTPQFRLTPETYLGYARADRFGSNEPLAHGSSRFTAPATIPLHQFAYQGDWNVESEYCSSATEAQLLIHFYSQQVFLVIIPPNDQATATVYLDNEVIPVEAAGSDVIDGNIVFSGSRLYHLVELAEPAEHTLRIDFSTPDTQVFAFTFGAN